MTAAAATRRTRKTRLPPLDGDDISEVAMNDDVTVVEDFTDVSDDELARLVADLRAELGEE